MSHEGGSLPECLLFLHKQLNSIPAQDTPVLVTQKSILSLSRDIESQNLFEKNVNAVFSGPGNNPKNPSNLVFGRDNPYQKKRVRFPLFLKTSPDQDGMVTHLRVDKIGMQSSLYPFKVGPGGRFLSSYSLQMFKTPAGTPYRKIPLTP